MAGFAVPDSAAIQRRMQEEEDHGSDESSSSHEHADHEDPGSTLNATPFEEQDDGIVPLAAAPATDALSPTQAESSSSSHPEAVGADLKALSQAAERAEVTRRLKELKAKKLMQDKRLISLHISAAHEASKAGSAPQQSSSRSSTPTTTLEPVMALGPAHAKEVASIPQLHRQLRDFARYVMWMESTSIGETK
jgi:hypothetical protein